MRCKDYHRPLDGVVDGQCPACQRPFDADNADTFLSDSAAMTRDAFIWVLVAAFGVLALVGLALFVLLPPRFRRPTQP